LEFCALLRGKGYISALPDGATICYKFKQLSSGYSWDTHYAGATMSFTIDVNGLNKPNQIGRDIFKVYLSEQGKIIAPKKYQDTTPPSREDCDPKGEGIYGFGFSCAYKVLT
jgi:hypothetical protein